MHFLANVFRDPTVTIAESQRQFHDAVPVQRYDAAGVIETWEVQDAIITFWNELPGDRESVGRLVNIWQALVNSELVEQDRLAGRWANGCQV